VVKGAIALLGGRGEGAIALIGRRGDGGDRPLKVGVSYVITLLGGRGAAGDRTFLVVAVQGAIARSWWSRCRGRSHVLGGRGVSYAIALLGGSGEGGDRTLGWMWCKLRDRTVRWSR
jgi:hypothetical protein